MTRQEISDVVEEAIRQAAEISGLTGWYVFHAVKDQQKHAFTDEQLLHDIGNHLEHAFEAIIDPQDREYWEHFSGKKHAPDR